MVGNSGGQACVRGVRARVRWFRRRAAHAVAAVWQAIAGGCDAVARIWRIAVIRRAQRRAPRIKRLARIRNPQRFVRSVLGPAGGHVALATALLSRRHRAEAATTLVACKAIAAFAAFGALDAAGIVAAAAYLTCDAAVVPRATAPRSTRSSDPVASLLIARLPLIRAALKALPGDTHRRCCRTIERIAAAMARARTDRRYRPDHVVGEAVIAAARIAVPAVHPPSFACTAWGRAEYLADQLRDAPAGREWDALLGVALRELPTMSRLLRWLPADVDGGTRAAAILLALATYRYYLHDLALGDSKAAGTPPLRVLHSPLRAALSAAWSRRGYLATVAAIEDRVLEDRLQASAAARAHGRADTEVDDIPDALDSFPRFESLLCERSPSIEASSREHRISLPGSRVARAR